MPTSPSFVNPARPHAARTALHVSIALCLVVGAVTLDPLPRAASAAALGTQTIGPTPIALNQPSDPEMSVITPTADAAVNGMFGSQIAWPVVPIHAALARDGRLVTFGTPLGTAAQGGLTYDTWSPAAGVGAAAHTQTASMDDYDSFCNSLVELDDGRLLMVGGNSTTSSMLYDPATSAQTMGQELTQQRWYATTLRLTDGRVLVVGGGNYYNTTAYQTPDDESAVATIPEIGSGTGAWTELAGAASTVAFGAKNNRWWYPRAFNGPLGTVVGTSGDVIWSLDTAGRGTTAQTGTLPFNPGVSGSQVMYAPGRVLVAGGGQVNNSDPVRATAASAVVDFTTATPVVTSTAPMAYPRNWGNLTVLPDGEVFANGGTMVGADNGGSNGVKQAEIWDPASGQWRTVASAQRIRTYHSVSLVLPSGAVFTGGGGVPGPEDNFNAELYYPSYLFRSGPDGVVRWASRPAITTIAGSAAYGGEIALTIADRRDIASVSLISSPAVTHSENTDQRRIPLTFTQSGGTVRATLPASVDTMPAGDYELTVEDKNGVPSAAQIITIRRGAAGLVTVGAGDPVVDAPVPTAGGAATAVGASGGPTAAGSAAQTGSGAATDGEAGTAPAVGSAPTTGSGTALGTGTAPVAGAAPGAGAAPVDGTTPSTGTATAPIATTPTASTGTTPTAGGSTAPPSGTVADPGTGEQVVLERGSTVSIARIGSSSTSVLHRGARVELRKAGAHSSRSVRRAASWIVRPGISGKGGYSFESLDRPGFYLSAPTGGNGTIRLIRHARSSRSAARATFAVERGLAGRGVSITMTAVRTSYLRLDGHHLVMGPIKEQADQRTAATFTIRHGLSRR